MVSNDFSKMGSAWYTVPSPSGESAHQLWGLDNLRGRPTLSRVIQAYTVERHIPPVDIFVKDLYLTRVIDESLIHRSYGGGI